MILYYQRSFCSYVTPLGMHGPRGYIPQNNLSLRSKLEALRRRERSASLLPKS